LNSTISAVKARAKLWHDAIARDGTHFKIERTRQHEADEISERWIIRQVQMTYLLLMNNRNSVVETIAAFAPSKLFEELD
jgi:hypothetical protein